MDRRRGVTLIELVVVICISLLMIAVLTPFVHMAKTRANRITCANNLRKMSLALHMYATGHNDVFPPDLGALHPDYIDDQSVFNCPATKKVGTKDSPDYNYTTGLTEASSAKEIIVQDAEGNHKKAGRNVLRIDGSLGWVGK